jgi:hypothetical protein
MILFLGIGIMLAFGNLSCIKASLCCQIAQDVILANKPECGVFYPLDLLESSRGKAVQRGKKLHTQVIILAFSIWQLRELSR